MPTPIDNLTFTPTDATPTHGVHAQHHEELAQTVAGTFSVMAFGAKGDGTTDDTAAILAALTAASTVGVGGSTVYFPRPSAHYKITAPLDLPLAPGLRVVGASVATIIKQYTNNTPIFRIAGDNMHSWEIRDLQFDYANVQASTNTAACGIYFKGSVAGPGIQIFDFKLENLLFQRGCDAIGGDVTTYYCAWGIWARNIIVNSGVTRSVCNIGNALTSGKPNIHFDNIYVRADNMVGPLWDMPAAENCQMDAIEINVASQGPCLIRDFSTGTYSIGAFKLEGGTYSPTNNPLFDFSNSTATFDRLMIASITMNPTVGSAQKLFRLGAGSTTLARVKIGVFEVGADIVITAGTQYIVDSQYPNEVTIDSFYGSYPSTMLLTDIVSSVSCNGVWVGEWNRGKISDDKGDANYTVAIGDPNVITYDTALTAVRTVTLPNPASGNMFTGLRYRIVRSGGGAFALNINKAPSTLLDSIPSGKTGAIEYTYRRAAWVQTVKALV